MVDIQHGLTPSNFPALGGSPVTQDTIDAVVQTIRQLCGWHVWPVQTEAIKVRTSGDDTVILPTKHIVNVVSVDVGGVTYPVPEDAWDENGILYLDWLPARHRVMWVTLEHGFKECPILSVVSSMVGRTAKPQESMTVGMISVGAPGAITPQSSEWRLIDIYRLGPEP